jgi:hypothetical protein
VRNNDIQQLWWLEKGTFKYDVKYLAAVNPNPLLGSSRRLNNTVMHRTARLGLRIRICHCGLHQHGASLLTMPVRRTHIISYRWQIWTKRTGNGKNEPPTRLSFLLEVSIVHDHAQNTEVPDYINSCEQNPIIQQNTEGFLLYNFSFKFFKSSSFAWTIIKRAWWGSR